MNDPFDDEPLELAPLEPAPAPARRPRQQASPAASASDPSAPPTSPRLDYVPRTSTDRIATGADTETIRDLYLPLWLLAGGVVIELIAAFFNSASLPDAAAALGADLIVNTSVLLVALLLAVKLRGIELGNFWTVLFKLAALSIAPRAASTALNVPLSHIMFPFGAVISLILVFVFTFALLGALFDLDESQTWYCMGVIIFCEIAMRVIVYYCTRT
jgi:hypothetical protein